MTNAQDDDGRARGDEPTRDDELRELLDADSAYLTWLDSIDARAREIDR